MPINSEHINLNVKISNELKRIINLISGIKTDDLDEETNFFSLGLDSLMLTQLKRKVENRFKVNIPFGDLLQEIDNIKKLTDILIKNADFTPEKFEINESVDLEKKDMQKENLIIDYERSQLIENVITDQLSSMTKLMINQLHLVLDPEVSVENIKNELLQNKAVERIDDNKFNRGSSIKTQQPFIVPEQENKLSADKIKYIKNLINYYTEKTKNSKSYAAKNRKIFADWINSLGYRQTLKEIKYPIVSKRSKGAKFTDIDGNEYVDIAMGYGVNFLGHRPEFVVNAIEEQLKDGFELAPQSRLAAETAELITEMTGVERVTFCNTGTEAVMAAIRLARFNTKRKKIALFAGSFHGTFDGVLAVSEDDHSFPLTAGTTPGMVEDVLVLQYGSPDSLEIIINNKNELAAVLVEPVQSRRPGFQPVEFLKELRKITEDNGIILIFDEIITGFRVAPGGCQSLFNITADIVTYGKIIGGGLPIGVVAGKAKYLDAIDGGQWDFGDDSYPEKEVTIFGGTFCKHPLVIASARASLIFIKEQGGKLQEGVTSKTEHLVKILNEFFRIRNVPIVIRNFGSLFRFESFGKYDLSLNPIEMDLFFYSLINKGVYTWERRICFLSIAHTDHDVEFVINSVKETIVEMQDSGFFLDNKSSDSALLVRDKKKLDTLTSIPASGLAGSSDKIIIFPMSSAQKRIYIMSQIDGGEKSYHLTGAWLITGRLDLTKLENIFRVLIGRHDALKTGFECREGKFLQIIRHSIDFKIEILKKSNGEYNDIISEFIKPFDFSNPPVVRAGILVESENRSLFILDTHHIIFDGTSLNIFMQELMMLYNDGALLKPSKPYVMYSEMQEQFCNSEKYKIQKEFWLNNFRNEPLKLNLPLDYPRPELQSFNGEGIKIKIPLQKLSEFARQNESTLFMVLLTAYYIWLHKLTNQKDIIIGVVHHGRDNEDLESTIGMFANTLPLRNFPDGDKSVKSFLSEVKSGCIAAFSNPDYQFDLLVEDLGIVRDKSRNPLFDIIFSYDKAEERIIRIKDLEIESIDFKRKASMFDIGLDVVEERGILNIDFEYNTDLFKRETMRRFISYYEMILHWLEDGGDKSISEIDILSIEEKQILLNVFNDTKKPYPEDKTINELFEKQVIETPERIALVYNEKKISFDELNKYSNSLANYLLEKENVTPDEVIGILLNRNEIMIYAVLGVLKSGASYLPIDPDYPDERIKYLVEDSSCRVILTEKKHFHRFQKCSGIKIINTEEILRSDPNNPPRINSSRNIAYIIYTSGSTGTPKGVMIEHRSVVNMVYSLQRNIYAGYAKPLNILFSSSLVFDPSVQQIFGTLLNGHTIHMINEDQKRNIVDYAACLSKNKIDIANETPSLFKLIAEYIVKNNTVTFLKYFFVGGEAIDKTSVEKFYLNQSNRNTIIGNVYGPTESCVNTTIINLTRESYTEFKNIPIGKPLDNTAIYLLNKHLELNPIGIESDIYISGDCLARGYLNNDALTYERFVPCPFNNGKIMYKTGDLGKWLDDGNLIFLGRSDEQVKIQGYRIELKEIEINLKQHPSIKDVCIITRLGKNNNPEILAYFISNSSIDQNILRDFLKNRLPVYMIPAYFIGLKSFPVNINGKIDAHLLPDPDEKKNDNKIKLVFPKNELQKNIAEVWKEILDKKEIGTNENYFELGGNSIKAIQIVSRLKQYFKIDISLKDIFTYPSIETLSGILGRRNSNKYPKIEAVHPKKYYDLSFSQKRLWIHDQLQKGSPEFNMTGSLLITGGLDINLIERSFSIITERYESLRTYIIQSGGEPRQVIGTEKGIEIEKISLESFKDYDEKAKDICKKESLRRFDLSVFPLLKLKLLTLPKRKDGKNRYVLIFNAHHMICDGWSITIILKEICSLYNSFLKKEDPDLPLLKFQYKDYSEWYNNLLENNELEFDRIFWQQKFEEEVPVLNLPLDFKRPEKQTFSGRRVSIHLNEDESSKTKKFCFEENLTLFMLFITTVKILLFKYTSQKDITVGIPALARELPELENQVGYFVNVLPVRDVLEVNNELIISAGKIKNNLTDAYSHQLYPFDKIIEDLGIKKDPSRNSLYDVYVNTYINNIQYLALDNLKVENFENETFTSKVDLEFYLEEGSEMEIFIEYNTDLFKIETIMKLLNDLRKIFIGFGENSGKTIKEFCDDLRDVKEISEQESFINSTSKLDEEF